MFVLLLAIFGSLAADRVLEPGWSAVIVRVLEDETSRPVAGALIETTCSGSQYAGERQKTDANGNVTVPIFRTWVALRVTRDGFTNGIVTLVGTNAVSSFRTNAVIRMRKTGR